MSLSSDLMRAENDIARLDFEKEYDEIISDLIAIYNRYYDTFKNAFNENTGAIIDLLFERCSQDFFAYAALVYVLCVAVGISNDGVLSYKATYEQSLKKLREEAERDAILNAKEAC